VLERRERVPRGDLKASSGKRCFRYHGAPNRPRFATIRIEICKCSGSSQVLSTIRVNRLGSLLA
jgi:hypothetical protein